MKIVFTKPTKADYEEFQKTLGDGSVLDGRIKIIVTDENGNTGCTFMLEAQREKLGDEYITSHAELEYSSFCEEYHVKISENDFYNDPAKYPVKVIPLDFEGTEGCREIYRGKESGKIYIRENHFPKEQFAKWYICGKHRSVDDGNEPRANLIFEYNGQQERVRYNDWNGVAAYSDTFNVDFNTSE